MKYPTILSQENTNDKTVLQLKIAPELDAFAGHFDAFPIIPGVVQIQWALHFFQQKVLQQISTHEKDSSVAWSIAKISALKFQHVITPDSIVKLHLTFDDSKCCLAFTINNDEHNYSSGKLFLEKS